MALTRRTALAAVVALLGAGCTGRDAGGTATGEGTTTTSDPTPTATPVEPTPAATPDAPADCDPADVTRPDAPSGGNLSGQPYPELPDQVTADSVAGYLADLETSFAWNRALATGDVTSINVDTLDGFVPTATDDGFLAASRMQVTVSVGQGGEDPRTEERAYVASYHVGAGPVYRAETEASAVDPRVDPDRQLVACESGGGVDYSI